MASDNLIFQIDKKYYKKTVGGEIQYILDSRFKGMAIPIRTILEIVCKLTQDGECRFLELSYGPIDRPIKLIIDKDQYDALIALANN